ncbi:MAG: MliC family protein [Alphaproteobacteria bacterium]|nr:MliC family protein [Alphaproteobacteria bacterium]
MKKILLTGLCVLALAACEKKDAPLAEVQLKCEEFGIAVKVYKDRIDAKFGDEVISLPQVEAASGAKYWVENIGLWNKGENWMLLAGDVSIECANVTNN